MKKSKLYVVLSAALLFGSNPAIAQDFSLGARGGLSIPNLSAPGSGQTPLNTGYSSRLGQDFAVFAEFKFSKLFSLQPMVEYSSQGGKKDGLQALAVPDELRPLFPPGMTPQYLFADYKSEAKLNYLMIPVLAKFGWDLGDLPLRLYVNAGPFVSFLLSAKQETSGQSELYLDEGGRQALPVGPQSFNNTEDIKNKLYTVNFGIEGNLGLNYRFGAHNIFIEGGGNYGLLNIQKDPMIGKNNTGGATANIGYSYYFGKHTPQPAQGNNSSEE